jgi:hypothetical protein
MDMSSLLLEERSFKISDHGLPSDRAKRNRETACERRRLQIKKLVSALVDPRRAPVLDQACRFAFLETFEEKKDLIHGIESQIPELAERNALAGAGVSDWDLDRIAWYLLQDWLIKKKQVVPVDNVVDSTRIELEKVGAKARQSVSLMPLHYSLAPIQAWMRRYADDSADEFHLDSLSPAVLKDVESVLERIESMLEHEDLDQGGQLRRTTRELRQLLGRLRDSRADKKRRGGEDESKTPKTIEPNEEK